MKEIYDVDMKCMSKWRLKSFEFFQRRGPGGASAAAEAKAKGISASGASSGLLTQIWSEHLDQIQDTKELNINTYNIYI